MSDPVARARLLRRVLGLRPAYDEARLALGRLQVETREYEGALESLKRIPEASRVGRTARFHEGVALLGLGRYAEASELYAALVAEGSSPAALNNQALALLRLGSGTARASSVLRRAIDLDKNAVDLPFNLGFALLTEGQAEAAAFWLETVVGRDPADARAQVVLAWAARMAGHEAQADALWRQVVAVSPSYEALATFDLARRFERIRGSEGPPLRGSDESSDPGPAAALVAHAEALTGEDRLDDALSELRRAVYLEPTDPHIHLLMARLYRARGESEKALASFRRSLWSRDDAAVRLEMEALASSPNP